MKKVLFLFLAFFLTTSMFAQDVCADIMKFNDYKKNTNRTSRMTSKTEAMNQTQVMEKDSKGNVHTTMTMAMPGNSMTMDMILIGETMYMKQNDGDWQTKPMDSAQVTAIKKQWQNGQLQFFKNCQKLDNEQLDGKNYRVFSGDFDPEKMKEMMSQSGEKAPNMDMLAQMEMKMKFYINDKDDLAHCTMKMAVMGQSFETVMDYEYDIAIAPIVAPEIPVEKKK
jgi:hypothetical protein